jgi:CubicO group peptidase (beta-lactamase class C family)
LLVDRGKIRWDDPVRQYLPGFRLADPVAEAHVTIRDLACHRTGLPRHDNLWYRSAYTREEVFQRIGAAKLTAPFRTTYQYQNICFMVAGEAARVAASADSFENFVRAELLTPLGMHRTNFSTIDAEADPNHARPHKRIKGKIEQRPFLNFDNCGPAGTMNSSASEMLLWLRFHLSGGKTASGTSLLGASALRETYLPQTIIPLDDDTRKRYPSLIQQCYCLGWALLDYKGHYLLCHGGAIDGFRAHVALAPRDGLALCLFLNLSTPGIESARNAILEMLLDVPKEDWLTVCKADVKKLKTDEKAAEEKRKEQRKNGKPSPLPLKEYVGTYLCPAYGTLTITREKHEDLQLQWNRLTTRLQHQTFTTFITTDHKEDFDINEATFVLDAAGTVTGLNLFDTTFHREKAAVRAE